MVETNAGARRPWLARGFAEAMNHYERGDGDREEEEEKWWRHEKWLGLMARSLFNSSNDEGGMQRSTRFAPKIMDQRLDLTQR
jgi:hypothetical protein